MHLVDTFDRSAMYVGYLSGSAAMRVQVKKWSDNASICIPAQVMSAAALKVDQAVDIRVEGGRMIIEPIVPAAYDLDDLLERMTPDTFTKRSTAVRPSATRRVERLRA